MAGGIDRTAVVAMIAAKHDGICCTCFLMDLLYRLFSCACFLMLFFFLCRLSCSPVFSPVFLCLFSGVCFGLVPVFLCFSFVSVVLGWLRIIVKMCCNMRAASPFFFLHVPRRPRPPPPIPAAAAPRAVRVGLTLDTFHFCYLTARFFGPHSWLVGRSVGWLGRSVGWLIGWLVRRSVDYWSVGWWPVGWLVG